MQQLRVVRLLPNGIESAKHKMNSSPGDREYRRACFLQMGQTRHY